MSKLSQKPTNFFYEIENCDTGEVNRGYYGKYDAVSHKASFVKMYIGKIPVFDKPIYDGYFFRLLKSLEHRTNRLIIWEKRIPRPLNRKDMRRIFGGDHEVTRQTVGCFLGEAEKRNVIKYVSEDRAFYVNPKLTVKGINVSRGVWELFDEKGFNETETV